jgi:hypothetical protein
MPHEHLGIDPKARAGVDEDAVTIYRDYTMACDGGFWPCSIKGLRQAADDAVELQETVIQSVIDIAIDSMSSDGDRELFFQQIQAKYGEKFVKDHI